MIKTSHIKKVPAIFFAAAILFASASFSSSSAVSGQTIVKKPEEAAKGLYQAWSTGKRKTAEKFGRAEAVEKLFGVRRQKMTFKGCTKREEGDYECLYESKGIDLTMAMIVKVFRAGYRVTAVSFSSEAI